MKTRNTSSLLALMFTLILLSFAGCGGGSSSGSKQTLSGTAAVGAPINGEVIVTDSSGVSINVAIDNNGNYLANVTGMRAPFLLAATPSDTTIGVQYSYASQANSTVNITPLTTLALFLSNNQQDLDTLFENWQTHSATFDTAKLVEAQKTVNANFQAQFQSLGLDATSYDFFTSSFSADGTGVDALLDSVSVTIGMNEGTFSVTVNGAVYSFSTEIDTSGIALGGDGGETTSSLPDGLAGEIVELVFSNGANGAPYTDGETVLFSFSSSGSLMLTQAYTVVADTFDIEGTEYVWIDTANAVKYAVTLLNGTLHEVNLMSTSGTFLGQFSPVTTSGSETGGSSTAGEYKLILSGYYSQNYNGSTISTNIGPMTLDGPFPLPDTDSIETSSITSSYGATGGVSITTLVNTDEEKKFRVQFTGTLGNTTAQYDLTYDYLLIE